MEKTTIRFWSMENPFWKGFLEGLAMMGLWRAIGRLFKKS